MEVALIADSRLLTNLSLPSREMNAAERTGITT
jgi:hypothetical protein